MRMRRSRRRRMKMRMRRSGVNGITIYINSYYL